MCHICYSKAAEQADAAAFEPAVQGKCEAGFIDGLQLMQ